MTKTKNILTTSQKREAKNAKQNANYAEKKKNVPPPNIDQVNQLIEQKRLRKNEKQKAEYDEKKKNVPPPNIDKVNQLIEQKRLLKNRKQNGMYAEKKKNAPCTNNDPANQLNVQNCNGDSNDLLEKNNLRREKYSQITDAQRNARNQFDRQKYSQLSEQEKVIYKQKLLIKSFSNASNEYFKSINELPNITCNICRRDWYPDQTNLVKLTEKHIKLLQAVSDKYADIQSIVLCKTCHQNLSSNKMPNIFHENMLNPGDIPEELAQLTDIEISLISNLNPIQLNKIIN